MNIAVLGAGYVGLVTAASLARMGQTVVCIDIDSRRVEALRLGRAPFDEPGLNEAVAEGLSSGRLAFEHDIEATHGSELALIAVGTLDEAGDWTDRHVENAVLQVAADHDAPRTIVVRSTLAPGTGERLERTARQVDPSVDLVVNPEFMRQGSAMADFTAPSRIVIGAREPNGRPSALVRDLYNGVTAPVLVTDIASAEMIKFASNVFLALKIGFANEIARLSEAVGADVTSVIDGVGMDRRIGRAFMDPGPGFGGSCLPSQARALPALARELGVDAPIVGAIDGSNRAQTEWVVDQLTRVLGSLRGKRVALLGLTFKAGTGDLRDSPAIAIGRSLGRAGAQLVVHDPSAADAGLALLEADDMNVESAADVLDALAGSDAAIVATEWPEYGHIDWDAAAATMNGTLVVDTRRIIDAQRARRSGLSVSILGSGLPADRNVAAHVSARAG